ncbi:MAG TPA: hypothetical protein VE441_15570 [Mycobacterium sp.]|nr:hypothetical protein [Mycobacterium sp.]
MEAVGYGQAWRDPTAPAFAQHADGQLAADVCDLAVQRLFCLGLSLESALRHHPSLAASLTPIVAQAEALIEEMRSLVFEQSVQRSEGGG